MSRDRLRPAPAGAPTAQSSNTTYPAPIDHGYEMANLQQPAGTINEFFAEIDDIRSAISRIDENVQRIEAIHQRSLNEIGDEQVAWNEKQLDSMIAETSQLTNNLKNTIKSLESKNLRLPPGGDSQTRKTQVANVKKRFMDAIQKYQGVERQFRQRYKQRIQRQYLIVNPNATEQEVQQVLDSEQGNQIFSQAVLTSNRHGEATSVLREVQSRHRDIQKIEKTITELAQLFQEMSILVEEQDATIIHIENSAVAVQQDVEKARDQTEIAVDSARAARRKKWICFAILILILAAVAVALAIKFGINNKK